MQEEHVSQPDSVASTQSVDHSRRRALVRLGTYSALATPAVMTLLAGTSASVAFAASGGPKDPKDPKDPKPPKR